VRRIRPSFALAVLLPLAACAAESRPAPLGNGTDELVARMDLTATGLQVGLSEPAYVAVFAMVEGGPVTMVYPTPSKGSYLRAGWTSLFPHSKPRRWTGRPTYTSSYFQTWHLMLVASRDSLGVGKYLENAGELGRELGPQMRMATNPDASISRLEALLRRGRSEESLTVAVERRLLDRGPWSTRPES